VGDLNTHDLIHEFWHSITHTDKGILKLIKDLFLHPKRVYLGYFSGQRKTYFSPVTFFLISAALLLLIGDKIYDYEDATRLAGNPNGYNEFGRMVFEATKFKTLLTIPFEVLLTWLLFRKRFNFAKNVVFWIYFNALLFTLDILLPLYFALFPQKQAIIFYVCRICTIILAHFNWFTNKKWLDYLTAFLIVNFFHILSYTTAYYMIFGQKIFEQTKTENIFEFVVLLYKYNV
jgi:hypothetical protein